MEQRKITVVVSRTNQKIVIMSSATTLGELKTDLILLLQKYSSQV